MHEAERTLKDNGDKDRADFIKVQCERAAKDRFDPEQDKLEKKEKEFSERIAERLADSSLLLAGVVGVLERAGLVFRWP